MTRWEPHAGSRLATAALELFAERGFEQTTVEDIAARAGVTKRTFFRHFPDKREVLFGGGDDFRRFVLECLAAVPDGTPPLAAVAAAFADVGAAFAGRADFARRRQRVIAANPGLQERELVKLAQVAAGVAAALVERGTPAPVAGLVAETGIAVFRTAFERWAREEDADLAAVVTETFATLTAVAAAPAAG